MKENNRVLQTVRNPEALMTLSFVLLFVSSIAFLSWKIDRGLDPDAGKDWWTVSFETRDQKSLDFAIENHGDKTRFTYTISRDQSTIETETIDIPKGSKKAISPKTILDSSSRVTITVEASDGNKKSVYR